MNRLRSALPAGLVALAVLARLVPGPRTIDDAFITFRYARNLLAGEGFVYNPGEAVLGTTTPLYTLVMAGLGALTGGTQAPFPLLALLVNTLADAATVLLLWQIGRRLGLERAGFAAGLAWAVAPFSVTFAIGGLETSLYVALLTGAVAAALWERYPHPLPFSLEGRREQTSLFLGDRAEMRVGTRVTAALLASLALLTRPDALILLGPLALERLWSAWKRREAIHWGEVAAAVIPYGAWAVYATLAFGSPLPHSILAKAAAYHLGAGEGLIRLVQHYATPFLEQNLLGAALAVGLGLVLYPFLFLVGGRRAWRAEPRILPWLLYPWLYLLTFAIPNPLIFRWYLTPPLPAYFFFILAGVEVLVGGEGPTPGCSGKGGEEPTPGPSLKGGEKKIRGIFGAVSRQKSLIPVRRGMQPSGMKGFRSAVMWAALVLPALVSLGDWRLEPSHGPQNPAPEMAYIQLELLYRQAAEKIAPQLPFGSARREGGTEADASQLPLPLRARQGRGSAGGVGPQPLLAAGDVGVLGFFTPARILDTVGLNSPVSTTYYPLPAEDYVINYAIPADLILDQQPDWVVILEVYGRRTLLVDARFQSQYRLVEKIETDMYGSDGMLVFERENEPPPQPAP